MSSSNVDDEADRPVEVVCNDYSITVTLADRRRITTPLWWYPRLLNATPEQRAHVEFMHWGIHWPEIDEDLSVSGMLKGAKAPGAVPPAEVA